MAVKAVGPTLPHARLVFGHEEFESTFLFLGELLLPLHAAVEFGVERSQREQVVLNGKPDTFRRDRITIKSTGEFRLGRLFQFGHHVLQLLIHFEMILHRHQRLSTQRGCATIPEEARLPGQIKERHAIASADTIFNSDAETTRIRESIGGSVATCTGERAIA